MKFDKSKFTTKFSSNLLQKNASIFKIPENLRPKIYS